MNKQIYSFLRNGINIPSSNKQPSLNESLPSYQILSSLKTYITKTFPKVTAVYFTNMYDISSSIQEYITNISTLYLNTNTSWAMSVSKSQTSGETHSQVLDAFESLVMKCLYKQIFNLIGTDSKLNRIILKYSFLNLNHFGISYPNIQMFFDFNKQVSVFSEIDEAITPKEKLRYICNICRYIIKIFGEGNLNKCLMFVILHCGVNNLKSHIRYVFLFRNKVLLCEDEEVYLDCFLKAFDMICNLKVMYKEILEISEEEFVSKSERFDMKEIIEGLILENGTFKNNYFLDDRLLALVNSEKRKNAEKGKEEKIVVWKDENGVPNLKELISKYKDIVVGKLSISELNELKIIFEKLIDIIVTIHNESKVIE